MPLEESRKPMQSIYIPHGTHDSIEGAYAVSDAPEGCFTGMLLDTGVAHLKEDLDTVERGNDCLGYQSHMLSIRQQGRTS